MDLSHLKTEESRLRATLTKAQRRLLIQKIHWFTYPRGTVVIDHLEWLFNHARTDRMPNLQLIGESMSGKSRLLKRFAFEMHAAVVDPGKPVDYRPVIFVESPASPSAKGILEEILLAANAPYPTSATSARLMDQIERVFGAIGVRVLIIDEIQHLLRGSSTKQREMRDQIKLIGNRLNIPIVTAGIPEASGAFASDPQLSNRFQRLNLPRWHFAVQDDVKHLMNILRYWQEGCPLQKRSDLLIAPIVASLFDNTGGLLGHIVDYLKKAAEYALDSGEECITESTLKRMGWIVPKEAKDSYLPPA